jgi:hypothetical protein
MTGSRDVLWPHAVSPGCCSSTSRLFFDPSMLTTPLCRVYWAQIFPASHCSTCEDVLNIISRVTLFFKDLCHLPYIGLCHCHTSHVFPYLRCSLFAGYLPRGRATEHGTDNGLSGRPDGRVTVRNSSAERLIGVFGTAIGGNTWF